MMNKSGQGGIADTLTLKYHSPKGCVMFVGYTRMEVIL